VILASCLYYSVRLSTFPCLLLLLLSFDDMPADHRRDRSRSRDRDDDHYGGYNGGQQAPHRYDNNNMMMMTGQQQQQQQQGGPVIIPNSTLLFNAQQAAQDKINRELFVGNTPPGTSELLLLHFLNSAMRRVQLCQVHETPILNCRVNTKFAFIELAHADMANRALR
jgi:hypothetical protein